MTGDPKCYLPEDRYFDPDPAQRRFAMELYKSVAHLPIVSPHGHVDPRLLADENASLGSPADLFIIPDHYVFRMLYSQGIPLENLGVPRVDGGPVERDHRKIWQIFADHFTLFRGTPTGAWLAYELFFVFGVEEKLTAKTAPVHRSHDHGKCADERGGWAGHGASYWLRPGSQRTHLQAFWT
jgi:glucuronate isomerase